MQFLLYGDKDSIEELFLLLDPINEVIVQMQAPGAIGGHGLLEFISYLLNTLDSRKPLEVL